MDLMDKTFLLFLLSICFFSPIEGSDPRSINGVNVAKGELEFVAHPTDSDGWWTKCGGSLIHEEWVLTAAHCVVGSEIISMVEMDRVDLTDEDVQYHNVTEIHVHPNYTSHVDPVDELVLYYDVAVLRISPPSSLQVIQLDKTGEYSIDDTKQIVAGWGYTDADRYSISAVLQQAEVQIIDCRATSYNAASISDVHLCAGADHTDSCRGDSGGPLFYQQNDVSFIQTGVTSYGKGCAQDGYPGVYTRISHPDILNFILHYIDDPYVDCESKVDLVYVVDHSGSIDRTEFQQMTDFFSTLTDQFEIGDSKTQIGSVWFSMGAGVVFPLGEYDDKQSIKDALRDTIQYGGPTDIAAGIYSAIAILGQRDGIPKVMVVITDGAQNHGTDAAAASELAQDEGWEVVSIGVGNAVDENNLNQISSSGTAYRVDNFIELLGLVEFIVPETCNCHQQPEVGNCRMAITRFYYNSSSGHCEHFIYGGCGDYPNNFHFSQECQEQCVHNSQRDSIPLNCLIWFDGCNECEISYGRITSCGQGYCESLGVERCMVFLSGTDDVESVLGDAESTVEDAESTVEDDESTSEDAESTPEGDESSVGDYGADETPDCHQGPEIGNCRMAIPRFYYNSSSSRCEHFIYGGCGDYPNNFRFSQECQEQCVDESQRGIIPSNCTIWFDGCNECEVSNGATESCGLQYCEVLGTATCIAFLDETDPSQETYSPRQDQSQTRGDTGRRTPTEEPQHEMAETEPKTSPGDEIDGCLYILPYSKICTKFDGSCPNVLWLGKYTLKGNAVVTCPGDAKLSWPNSH